MRIKLSALAGLATALAAAPAHANCSGGAFAGPYLGLNIGAAFADVSQTSPDDP